MVGKTITILTKFLMLSKMEQKWADEHPKEGLVSIDKACEWWSEWFDTHNPCNMGNCIDEFRKAMEELNRIYKQL